MVKMRGCFKTSAHFFLILTNVLKEIIIFYVYADNKDQDQLVH